jgi:hypothetical protein
MSQKLRISYVAYHIMNRLKKLLGPNDAHMYYSTGKIPSSLTTVLTLNMLAVRPAMSPQKVVVPELAEVEELLIELKGHPEEDLGKVEAPRGSLQSSTRGPPTKNQCLLRRLRCHSELKMRSHNTTIPWVR